MNSLSKMLTAVAVLCLFTACAKKTQETVQYSPPSEQRSQQGDRPQNRRGGPPQFSQLLTEMDSNKDGQLAASEVQGPLKNDFAKIDTNEDGFISESEFKNAPKPQRQGRGERRN